MLCVIFLLGVVLRPLGKVGVLQNASTFYSAYVPMPGGGAMSLGCCSSTNIWYLHRDWLGTSRAISSVPASGNGSVINDRSFSPFGDVYQNNGYNDLLFFAGLNADLFATSGTGSPLYDTPNRELAMNAGRWLSPDPAGLAAVDPANPQRTAQGSSTRWPNLRVVIPQWGLSMEAAEGAAVAVECRALSMVFRRAARR